MSLRAPHFFFLKAPNNVYGSFLHFRESWENTQAALLHSLHSASVCASHLTLKWSWGRWDLAPQFMRESSLEGEVTWLARAPRAGRGESGQEPSAAGSAGLLLPHGCPVRPELRGKPWCLFSLFSFWSLPPSSLPGGWYGGMVFGIQTPTNVLTFFSFLPLGLPCSVVLSCTPSPG